MIRAGRHGRHAAGLVDPATWAAREAAARSADQAQTHATTWAASSSPACAATCSSAEQGAITWL
jgi:hypothetical protein